MIIFRINKGLTTDGFQAIACNEFQKHDFENLYSKSTTMKDLVRRSERKMKYGKNIMQDIYFSLFQSRIALVDKDDISSDYVRQYYTICELIHSEKFNTLHKICCNNQLASALATIEIFPKLIEEMTKKNQDNCSSDNIESICNEACENTCKQMVTAGRLQVNDVDNNKTDVNHEIIDLLHNKNVRTIIQNAGRLEKSFLYDSLKGVGKAVTNNVDIRKTNDILHVSPSELIKFTHPLLKKLFIKDFIENQLTTMNIKKGESNGPVIIAIDTSSSMSGNRIIWAKSVAIAMIKLNRRKRRDSYVILFSDRDEITTVEFSKSQLRVDLLKKVLKTFYEGGTDFTTPLMKSLSIIKENHSYKKADIIFITDGDCQISPSDRSKISNLMRQTQARLFTFQIDSDTISRALKKLSVSYVQMTKLNINDGVAVINKVL